MRCSRQLGALSWRQYALVCPASPSSQNKIIFIKGKAQFHQTSLSSQHPHYLHLLSYKYIFMGCCLSTEEPIEKEDIRLVDQKIIVTTQLEKGHKQSVLLLQPASNEVIEAPAPIVEKAPEEITIRGAIANVGGFLLNTGDQLLGLKGHIVESQAFHSCRRYRQQFNKEVTNPLTSVYTELPTSITEAKFNLITPYSYSQRFIAINLICTVTAILTFRRMAGASLIRKSLRAFRNSGAVYLGGGLLLTPEIYNPLMKE